VFRNYASIYCEELLALGPTSKLEDCPLSALRGCLFNIFAATLHIGGRSSIRNLRTRYAVMTGTLLSCIDCSYFLSTCGMRIAETNLVRAAFTSYVLSVSYARSCLSGRIVHCWNYRISMKQPSGFDSVALQATSIEALICATDKRVR
jgi:hypothetical protein